MIEGSTGANDVLIVCQSNLLPLHSVMPLCDRLKQAILNSSLLSPLYVNTMSPCKTVFWSFFYISQGKMNQSKLLSAAHFSNKVLQSLNHSFVLPES